MFTTYSISDIDAALRFSNVDHDIADEGTEIETIRVTRTSDGRVVTLAPSTTETGETANGIDVAYLEDGAEAGVRTQDWVPTVEQIVANLRTFLAR